MGICVLPEHPENRKPEGREAEIQQKYLARQVTHGKIWGTP